MKRYLIMLLIACAVLGGCGKSDSQAAATTENIQDALPETVGESGAETVSETDENMDAEDELEPSFEIRPYRDVLGLTQVLRSDERVEIKLIGFGIFEDGSEQEYLRGVLSITNKTEEEIPYSLQEVIINGTCITLEDSVLIGSGHTYFSEFALRDETLDNEGITSIESASLFMMVDSSENSSIAGERMMGGKTYDIELAEQGVGTPWSTDGELVYNENDIKVYAVGSDVSDGDAGLVRFAPSATFNLIVENESDKDISFNYSDIKLDGKECGKGNYVIKQMDGSHENLDVLRNVIPAGSRKSVSIYFRHWDMTFPCNLSCRFDFTSAGGGQILYRSDEIHLTAKELPEEE